MVGDDDYAYSDCLDSEAVVGEGLKAKGRNKTAGRDESRLIPTGGFY